ncbi:hypothetical protein [uncultured Sphingomonas sp.]|uniref:hypothetical protein n=1 Tax=uncultured Sphingomonas sp. TaxID=158754 RepID=UPI0037494599
MFAYSGSGGSHEWGFMMIKTVGVFAGALVLAAPVTAQMPAAPIAAPNYSSAVLRTGTEVPLRLSEELTTKGKKLRVGQRVHLETAEPVIVQGITVIPVGSPAIGEITDVKNKGMWGKSGHLGARVLYVTVNGRQIRLSGAFDDKGTAGTAGVVGAAVLLPVAGFFVTGTSATVPAGTVVKGFLDEDVPLAMAAAGPEPLVISAAAATPATAPVATPAPTLTPVNAISPK